MTAVRTTNPSRMTRLPKRIRPAQPEPPAQQHTSGVRVCVPGSRGHQEAWWGQSLHPPLGSSRGACQARGEVPDEHGGAGPRWVSAPASSRSLGSLPSIRSEAASHERAHGRTPCAQRHADQPGEESQEDEDPPGNSASVRVEFRSGVVVMPMEFALQNSVAVSGKGQVEKDRQSSRLMTQNSCVPTSSSFGLHGRMSLANSGIALKLNLLSLK